MAVSAAGRDPAARPDSWYLSHPGRWPFDAAVGTASNPATYLSAGAGIYSRVGSLSHVLHSLRVANNPADRLGGIPLRAPNPHLANLIALEGTRGTGVARATALEVQLVQKTGRGTTNWTAKEITYIKQTGQLPKGTTGHHINSVAQHPDWAGDPRNIQFLRSQAENLAEHGGNFQNVTSGPLIDREALIRHAAEKNK
jgi:hypothetical protein